MLALVAIIIGVFWADLVGFYFVFFSFFVGF